MNSVRIARQSDVPVIVVLAREEHALSPWSDIPFDEECTAEVVDSFVVGMGRTALLSGGGYLLGLVQPMGFSRALAALEYAWYARDGAGLEILGAFEDWARSMGANHIVAHDYAGDGRLANVLERRKGYRTVGTALALKINEQAHMAPVGV